MSVKTVLVTGSEGFIGKNLIASLRQSGVTSLLQVDVADGDEVLHAGLDNAEVIFHLAGVNRPKDEEEFKRGNADLTSRIVQYLLEQHRTPLLVLSSSTQAQLDNAYGRSKRAAETALEEYGAAGGPAIAFRLPNVFGKWSRANYNSVVATFCHNIARGLDITVSDPNRVVELVYVDDVVETFVALLQEPVHPGFRLQDVGPVRRVTLAELAHELYGFRDIRERLELPDLRDRFRRALYATYLSFLPTDAFAYALTKREDQRGSLAEVLKSHHAGQLFVSRTRPGFVRGNHYHHTKAEKFCVLEGKATIRFRHILSDDVITYAVEGADFHVVDIPPGYTHSIENAGTTEMVVLFWASEVFDPGSPDTFSDPVVRT